MNRLTVIGENGEPTGASAICLYIIIENEIGSFYAMSKQAQVL